MGNSSVNGTFSIAVWIYWRVNGTSLLAQEWGMVVSFEALMTHGYSWCIWTKNHHLCMENGAQVPGAAKLASILDAGILTFISLTEHDEFLAGTGFMVGWSFSWVFLVVSLQQPRLVGYQLPLTPIFMDVYNAHCYVYQCEHYYCTLYIYNYLYTHNTYTEYHELLSLIIIENMLLLLIYIDYICTEKPSRDFTISHSYGTWPMY